MPQPEKTGKILTDHFSTQPDDLRDLKNGPILLFYINQDKSVIKTIKTLIERLPCQINQNSYGPKGLQQWLVILTCRNIQASASNRTPYSVLQMKAHHHCSQKKISQCLLTMRVTCSLFLIWRNLSTDPQVVSKLFLSCAPVHWEHEGVVYPVMNNLWWTEESGLSSLMYNGSWLQFQLQIKHGIRT